MPGHAMFTSWSSALNNALTVTPYGRRMAPLITRLVRSVAPQRGAELGTCLVCRDAVRDPVDAVRLSGGGFVHHDCATYRMRQRYGRPLRPASPNGHDRFTGE